MIATQTPEPATEPVAAPSTPSAPATTRATPVTAQTAPSAAPEPVRVPVPGPVAGKLRMGELRGMVAAYLAAHPGETFTPGAVAKALDRSSGAVGNALAALGANGAAEIVSERPMRYRATPATAAAALAPPSRAPRTTGTTAPSSANSNGSPSASKTRKPRTKTSKASSNTGTVQTSTAPGASSAGSPGVPAATEPVTGPVSRPNGQNYHPRTLADLPDVTALRKLREEGIPALLYGPPGTGKTSLVEAAYPDLITVAGDGDTSVADFIGEYVQTPGGGYEFVYGPLVTAMREGRTLFIDDATLISPKVLAVVYPAMDGRRQIQVKAHKGETITAAEGFYVVAGHNPGVHGAVLTEALSSRFAAQIRVSTDYDLATALKIDTRAVKVAKDLAIRQVKGEIGWAPQLRELLAFQRITGVLGLDAAVANLVGIAPEEDRDVVARAVTAAYGRTFTPLALGRQI
jgi:nitric oxide reductase NorQ protein